MTWEYCLFRQHQYWAKESGTHVAPATKNLTYYELSLYKLAYYALDNLFHAILSIHFKIDSILNFRPGKTYFWVFIVCLSRYLHVLCFIQLYGTYNFAWKKVLSVIVTVTCNSYVLEVWHLIAETYCPFIVVCSPLVRCQLCRMMTSMSGVWTWC
jgi:hypothetical protein